MGTRCITRVFDEDQNEILCMYRQFDGYLSGHGDDLLQFIENTPLTNGIAGSDRLGTSFNGMGCFAASLVAHFKDRVGGIYLYPPNTTDVGEEYVYECYPKGDRVKGYLEIGTKPKNLQPLKDAILEDAKTN